eukprot:COSAG02_NODE_438_length_22319_cov_17.198425_17_plen_76_part_00
MLTALATVFGLYCTEVVRRSLAAAALRRESSGGGLLLPPRVYYTLYGPLDGGRAAELCAAGCPTAGTEHVQVGAV